jgi:DnaJ-class molecular chaperone
MNRHEYWIEAVESSLDEAGIGVTAAQLSGIVADMMMAHEQESTAFGDDVAAQNLSASRDRKVADLRRELSEERAKVVCSDCGGRGTTVVQGPCHSSQSTCWTCNGEGRR